MTAAKLPLPNGLGGPRGAWDAFRDMLQAFGLGAVSARVDWHAAVRRGLGSRAPA